MDAYLAGIMAVMFMKLKYSIGELLSTEAYPWLFAVNHFANTGFESYWRRRGKGNCGSLMHDDFQLLNFTFTYQIKS